ncbi:hypothetical protein [Bradyrhizobium sp.]
MGNSHKAVHATEPRFSPVTSELADDIRVTVCDNCLQASCWQGIFMCYESVSAGTTVKTVAELRKLNLENESYWT